MQYQIRFMIRMVHDPKAFQWECRYIHAKTNKEAIKEACRMLRSFRKAISQQIKEGKRRPDHALILAISEIVPLFLEDGHARTKLCIYKRKKKFGNIIP